MSRLKPGSERHGGDFERPEIGPPPVEPEQRIVARTEALRKLPRGFRLNLGPAGGMRSVKTKVDEWDVPIFARHRWNRNSGSWPELRH